MEGFWNEVRVLVSGGAGFIGSHLVDSLVELGARVRVADNLSRGSQSNLNKSIDKVELVRVDLTDPQSCRNACSDMNVVMGLAAQVGGIQFNQDHQGDMFRLNVQINLNMLEAARIVNVERYLAVSSACVYARETSVPTPETEGFLGHPEKTNFGYGWAKRFVEVQAKAYSSQYGMKIGVVRPYNTYGPRDNFSLEDSHVIPALIRRASDGADPIEVWGSGEQTRSFIYVEDVVEGMLLGISRHPEPDPINIGSSEEISVARLVQIILEKSGRHSSVVFDRTKPEGQVRRKPDVEKAKRLLGFEAKTSLIDGIAKTVRWFSRSRREQQPVIGLESSRHSM
ncbi:NAD-dependent epimerase/dehydratase family protein [Candidatus Bathyarchaeota archaeon]|nr:MAG: NAD-dependent epimerase/dehydratase family protein [Candidatus Bathyarchaeota archaeon]